MPVQDHTADPRGSDELTAPNGAKNAMPTVLSSLFGTLTIRKLYLGLSALIVIGMSVYGVLWWQKLASEQALLDAYESRYESYLLADELRQSSDDLTRLARTYVLTGDSKYEQQYMDILAIRNGTKPRPVDAHRIYWDFVAATGKAPRPDGKAVPLKELMKRAGFTEAEFDQLKQAEANSNGLVGLEVRAMNAVKGKFADKDGKYTVSGPPDQLLAQKLMHSDEYHKFKADIMLPVDDFFGLLEKRTKGAVDTAAYKIAFFEKLMLIMAAVVTAGLVLTGWVLMSRIIGPIGRLSGSMTSLADGDKETKIPFDRRGDEIGDMARTISIFKTNMIEAERLEVEQREAEKRAQEAETKRVEEKRAADAKAEEERRAADARTEEERKQAMLDMAESFEKSVMGIVDSLSSAATEMQSSAETMSAAADQTAHQATAVAAASEEASTNVQTVASAAEELSASVEEISRQVGQSNQIAQNAVTEVKQTNEKVEGLADAAQKIGEVVNLINDIASQTNLLALNATIEAARAGEAGKGFAVVASEVKSLATQTGKATEEIAAQIAAIQGATSDAVQAIQGIGSTISQIGEIATSIASAVEEQGASTREIAGSVQQAASGTQEVSGNITQVTQAASESQAASGQMLGAAKELSQQGTMLRQEVDRFLETVRAA